MMNAVAKIISIEAFLLLSALSYGSNDDSFTVYFKYDKPVNNYVVTGEFYPFGADTETGQVTLKFKSLTGGQDFVYSNVGKTEKGYPQYPAKFSGYNICEHLSIDERTRFHDGDTLIFHYNTKPGIFEASPLYYYAEFQFFDVDFDGNEEFLVNDYYKGQGGNNYTVYEITPKGLKEKTFKPFDRINNTTVFDASRRVIRDVLHDGVYYSGYTEYQISPDGNSAKVVLEEEY